MNVNVSLDEEIDNSGLIVPVTQRNSKQILVVLYRWPALFLLFFSIFGIVGNLLVCLAIGTERRLHNRTNWVLFSLAFADILISGFVIPLAIIKEFTGFWILGTVICDLWIFVDVLSCTSSIMHIVVISIDRYLGIKDPLNVRSRQEKHQVCVLIILVWLIAILLSSPMIALGVINPYNIIINGQCFINNQFFVIYGSVVSFVIPLIIVIVVYVLTVHRLKKQIKEFQEQFDHEQTSSQTNPNGSKPILRRQRGHTNVSGLSSKSNTLAEAKIRRKRLQRRQTSFDLGEDTFNDSSLHQNEKQRSMSKVNDGSFTKLPSSYVQCGDRIGSLPKLQTTCNCYRSFDRIQQGSKENSTCPFCSRITTTKVTLRSLAKYKPRPMSLPAPNVSDSSLSSTFRPFRRTWHRLSIIPSFGSTRTKCSTVRNEQKALKVLGIVFVIFVIAWFPFCILNVLQAVCKNCSINPDILNGCVWLGYVSASINPVVYTIFNRNFRLKFIELLKCQCLYDKNRQRQLSIYQSYTSLHGPRMRHANGLVQNDIRRSNDYRQCQETAQA